jgi:hypothetical protein
MYRTHEADHQIPWIVSDRKGRDVVFYDSEPGGLEQMTDCGGQVVIAKREAPGSDPLFVDIFCGKSSGNRTIAVSASHGKTSSHILFNARCVLHSHH